MKTGSRLRREALSSVAALACGLALSAASSTAAQTARWTAYTHPQTGFSLRYPAGLLMPKPDGTTADGQLFVSPDNQARLIVGAFANDGDLSLRAYRDFILTENFKGATLDYAPVRTSWFVISGTRGSQTFYQRVAFTCGGRLINSWAMIYPSAQKRLYDRVVEGVHKSYMTGRGPAGACSAARNSTTN